MHKVMHTSMSDRLCLNERMNREEAENQLQNDNEFYWIEKNDYPTNTKWIFKVIFSEAYLKWWCIIESNAHMAKL